ncbi:MAG: glycerophosphodiester phosphodiesterase family protein [Fodinibius sp.]|nr:glycerophosphodiester phosphodiesterase family protein [Fodinibius sp.]
MSQTPNLPSLYNDDGDGFTIIAHRGASAYYPENTMAAFRGAEAMDAEMIELDVLLSKDGVPVVFHDAHLEDHTNGTGLVRDHTLEELKTLNNGSWFDDQYSGQQIPTLEEVLKFASEKIALNIEIKTEAVTDQLEDGVAQKSLALVQKYDMEEHVLFSSFDYRAVAHLKELAPTIPVAVLYNNRWPNHRLPHELVREYSADAFNCSYRQLTKRRLANLRTHNIPSFVYTVDRKSRMRKLIAAGVNGIFTNKPDLLREVVQHYHR